MNDREKLIHNEQVKLSATFMNSIAVGTTVGGGFVTAWQMIINSTGSGFWPSNNLLIVQAVAFGGGFFFHQQAKKHLENLVD
jgi:hypothetical protein